MAVKGHNLDLASSFESELFKQIKKINLHPISQKKPLTSIEEVKKSINIFKDKDIDLLIIINGTWAPDQYSIRLASELNVPLVMWSIPEPLNGKFVELASLVGLSQNGGTLSRMGFNPYVIIAPADEPKSLEKLQSIANAAGLYNKLKTSSIGLIESGCPGMLDTDFDELNLKKHFGVELDRISVSSLKNKIKSIDSSHIDKKCNDIVDIYGNIDNISDSILRESISVYLGLKDWINEKDLEAVAVKCWPEFKEIDIVSPCLALSLLNEEGIPSSCEGDLYGALSMLCLHYLSNEPAYLGDLMKIEENELYFFHCGAAAHSLSTNKNNISFKNHSFTANWKPGVTVEFPIKSGSLTFGRIDQNLDGSHQLVTYNAEAISCEMVCRGNPMKISLKQNPHDLIQKLVDEGTGHHQLCVHGNYKDDLAYFSEIANMAMIDLN